MTKLFFILLIFGVFAVLFFRTTHHRPSRTAGILLIFLATACFSLYAFDIVGVGLSELLVKLFEEMGETA